MSFQIGAKSYGRQSQSVQNAQQTIPNQTGGSVVLPSTKPRIFPQGSPSERLWIIAEAALSKDADKGYLFSSALGWNYKKILDSNNISRCFITSPDCYRQPQTLVEDIIKYQPPVIICLDNSIGELVPSLLNDKSQKVEALDSWAGSLLISPLLNYPHYVIPTFGPEKCVSDWIERQIVQSIDIAKAKSELDFWNANSQTLQLLPQTTLVTDLDYLDLMKKLDSWEDDAIPYISVDVESIYPREKSDFYGHPGYPVIVGIAPSPYYGISFNLWPKDKVQAQRLWWRLARLLSKKKIIGQNFDMFDARHFDMLGMPIELTSEVISAQGQSRIYDTRLRHAVLWPELKHSLQFQTRQYTRQAYYKDEGKGWNPKDMTRWMRYNALDCCTTYAVFLGQEEEFDERPHLR
jgi:hypothetical protein